MAKIEGAEQVNRALSNLPARLIRNVVKIIDLATIDIQRYLRTERLTGGTTETKLRVRSGKLRGSVGRLRTEIKGDRVEGGVSIGTAYARTHFGPRGQVTTILPKRANYLTIPLPAAMTNAGVPKGSAMGGPWGDTFIAKSKKGNLIIFGKMQIQKGKKAGGLRSQIVPLFLLKKQVQVRARIDPMEILGWISPKVKEALIAQGLKVTGD